MALYDVDQLLANIRRRAMAPTATAPGTADSDLLALANAELQGPLSAKIKAIREEYFVAAVNTTVVGGTAAYDIPPRAMGAVLRDVVYVDSGSGQTSLVRYAPEHLPAIRFIATQTGVPRGFYVQGNQLILVPTPNAGGTLKLTFERRPAQLVTVASCATITSVDGGGLYSCDKPASITIASPCDLVRATPHFDVLTADNTPASVVAGTSVTFSASITGAVAGDYICLAGQAPVPQIPVEFHPVLEQRVAVKLLEILGFPGRLEAAMVKLREIEDLAVGMISTRVEGEPQYLVNRWWS